MKNIQVVAFFLIICIPVIYAYMIYEPHNSCIERKKHLDDKLELQKYENLENSRLLAGMRRYYEKVHNKRLIKFGNLTAGKKLLISSGIRGISLRYLTSYNSSPIISLADRIGGITIELSISIGEYIENSLRSFKMVAKSIDGSLASASATAAMDYVDISMVLDYIDTTRPYATISTSVGIFDGRSKPTILKTVELGLGSVKWRPIMLDVHTSGISEISVVTFNCKKATYELIKDDIKVCGYE